MNKKIDRDNYEIFFLDYFDGNLPKDLIEDLFIFLDQNFDLKEEFEQMSVISINPDKISFPNKNSLKKTESKINNSNYNEYLAASIEGDLNNEELIELNQFINQNPQYKKEFEIIGKTKLVDDDEIIFENKNSLKHRTIQLHRNIYSYVAVAASVIIVFGIFILTHKSEVSKSEYAKLNHTNLKTRNISTNKLVAKTSIKTTVNNNQKIETKNKDLKKEITTIENAQLKNHSEVAVINKIQSKEIKIIENAMTTEQENPSFFNTFVNSPTTNNYEIAKNNIQENKNIISKLIVSSSNFINKVSNKSKKENLKEGLWNLAFLGLRGYNKVLNRNIDMEKRYNDDGTLASVSIITSDFRYSKEFKK